MLIADNQRFPKEHEPTAFGINRQPFFCRLLQGAAKRFIPGKKCGLRLRETAPDIQGIHGRQHQRYGQVEGGEKDCIYHGE